MQKKTATVNEQIQTMKSHGIQFTIATEQQAARFLTQNIYFFKLKAYEQNYQKDNSQTPYQYQGLEFAYLQELYAIDSTLSRAMWDFCSAIEHAMKIRFNNLLMQNRGNDYESKCMKLMYGSSEPRFEHSSPYTDGLKIKYGHEYTIWTLWELLTFMDQQELYRKYLLAAKIEDPIIHLLGTVRQVRNAVSHGNCLLANMKQETPKYIETGHGDQELIHLTLRMCDKSTKRKGNKPAAFRQSLNQLVVNNTAAVLICFLNIVDSAAMIEHAINETNTLTTRINRNRQQYFSPNYGVERTFQSLVTLFEAFIKKAELKANAINTGKLQDLHDDTTIYSLFRYPYKADDIK
ncbi:Abi family protein [Bifidobacterium sp. ESL0769]|uniref:Abi family protein n=1 Tax=Bifidobacterium sp. ESL0769 TaxID=2983229 RepID=UPI0023F8D970|nr:Abi family protein [Bifidobacterium sp. ESL0769]WEV67357.1 Abi family protein [Bifidobacterium sp. ESL0769]